MENTIALDKKELNLPKPLKSLQAVLNHPGAFFRYQPHNLRALYHTASRFLHVRTWLSRCLPLGLDTKPTIYDIEQDKGYKMISGIQSAEAVAEIRAIVARTNIDEVKAKSNKPYLLSLMKGDELSRDSEIYKFVTNRKLVKGVSRYLKCFPILTYIAIWYSPNESAQNDGSQRFHLDHEDYRQVKGFLYAEDVDADTGPFTTLDGVSSDKVQKTIGYRMTPDEKRVDDDVVYGIVDASNTHPLVGKAGDLALVDTSRCFHYGSREGKRPRILMTFQYMTPFAYVMPWNWRKKTYLGNFRANDLPEHDQKLLGMKI